MHCHLGSSHEKGAQAINSFVAMDNASQEDVLVHMFWIGETMPHWVTVHNSDGKHRNRIAVCGVVQ